MPESAEPVTDSDEGTIVLEKTDCGDETCHCAEDDGESHGPYLYRYLYDGDSVSSEYIGKPENHPEMETA